MEASLYSDFVKTYFPNLVLEVTEKLNEKAQQTLPYSFKNDLVPIYSADSRWASVIAKYNQVAAHVVALDSSLPNMSRDAIEVYGGDIPKIGMSMYLTEKQQKDIQALIATGTALNVVLDRIFEDTPKCISGIWETLEAIYQSELSTGVGLAPIQGTGTGVRIDMKFDNANKFGVKVVWNGNPDTAKPDEDIKRLMDKADADGNVIIKVKADDAWISALGKTKAFREMYAFNLGFTGQNIPVLNREQVASVLMANYGITLERVNRKFKTENNGTKGNHTAWQRGVASFLCTEKTGSLVWTDVVEATRPVQGVTYQTADNYILMSKYAENNPWREFTTSQAMVIPVLNNTDKIYLLNSTEVQA